MIQKMTGLVRRCVDVYNMIKEGDKIAVGVSGGKDSLVLLVLLAELKKYFNKSFQLEAITIDMGLGMDYSGVEALCRALDVPYTVVKTEIDPIIFDLGTGLRFFGESLDRDDPLRALALVTHLHWDHVQGFPFFVPLHHPGASLTVYGRADEGTIDAAFRSFMIHLPARSFF